MPLELRHYSDLSGHIKGGRVFAKGQMIGYLARMPFLMFKNMRCRTVKLLLLFLSHFACFVFRLLPHLFSFLQTTCDIKMHWNSFNMCTAFLKSCVIHKTLQKDVWTFPWTAPSTNSKQHIIVVILVIIVVFELVGWVNDSKDSIKKRWSFVTTYMHKNVSRRKSQIITLPIDIYCSSI